ncbi:MAG TPA: GntR family transcriptional regulator [Phenylobacterium sp.]|nr:GntR family transcriptional regulator [Phenylobacterium sp.]
MSDATPTVRAEPSKLQRKLAVQIAEFIRDNDLQEGQLTELGLAEALNVSRTPIRAALEYLAGLNIVAPSGQRRGFRVTATPAALAELTQEAAYTDEEEALYLRIASDYVGARLPDQFSEADMMRQYGVGRGMLLRVLQRMARERVIERNPGYGWRFAPLLRSMEAHDGSYRFRMVVEPAALMEPGFALDPAWAARTRRAHDGILATPAGKLSMVRFFEVNADFHAGLAACSGNPFFHEAVLQQNQLRRFLSYAWELDERIAESCHEHMAILTALEKGDRDWAATLMRRHLDLAAREKPPVIRGDDA